MPILDRITIYPVKSLDGLDLARAEVLAGGGLTHDRRWQVIDLDGRVVNAKRLAILHAIRAEFGIAGVAVADRWEEPAGETTITLSVDSAAVEARAMPGIERLTAMQPETFPLVPGAAGPCGWLAEVVGFDVRLLERADGGFPDDREAAGPTVVSTATLAELARWFGFTVAECRRRLRANLELGECDAFWEDTLAIPAHPELALSLTSLSADLPADPYAALPPPEPRRFMIGGVEFQATSVCRRCVVPGRDSRTGAVTEHFRDAFEARRTGGMRADVDASAWSHAYRAAVNTVVVGAGGSIATGQSRVVIADPQH